MTDLAELGIPRAWQTWRLPLPHGRDWVIGPRAAILGILNVTPDSFSDGGRLSSVSEAVRVALGMVDDGADAIDIGGESTRPGAEPVSTAEQIRRVLPVLRELRGQTEVPISVDTRDPRVGEAALEAGADVINDVSACADPGWIPVLRASSCPVVLMHMRGTPQDMRERTSYEDGVLTDIADVLSGRMDALEAAGVSRSRFIVDPGIGFAKEAGQNVEILAGLRKLGELGRPVLVGASRKIFLGKIVGSLSSARDERASDPAQRDVGTVAANAWAVLAGASILRVHNVAYTRDLVAVLEALRQEALRLEESRLQASSGD